MPHRYFTSELGGGAAALTGPDAHHLAHVMRAAVGDTVLLCGPDGLEYTGTVTALLPGRVEFCVSAGIPSRAEPGVEATLYIGYPKQGKLEDIVRHGVELGAARFVPFFSRWCVAAPKNEDKKKERYNRIAAEAAKQAGRGRVPAVLDPLPDTGALCAALAKEKYDLALFFYENGGAALRGLVAPGQAKRIALITGSEGGFAPEEAAALQAAGAVAVGLGPRILRCETAPLAALAAVLALAGELE